MQPASVQNLDVNEAKLARAEKVARRARLRDIRLVNLNFRLRELAGMPLLVMRHGFGHRFERGSKGDVLVYCDFRVELANDSDESRADPPFFLEGSYGLVYEIEGGIENLTDDEFASFAEVNGQFNAWPFVRELVHSVAGRAGVEPPTTPPLRVANKAGE